MSNIGRRGGDLTVLEICIIAVGLSLDVFAYSLYKGAMLSELKKATMVKLILIFTIWQMGSILLGNLFTLIPAFGEIATRTEEIWKFVSAFIFIIIGNVMGSTISEASKKTTINLCDKDNTSFTQSIIQSMKSSGSEINKIDNKIDCNKNRRNLEICFCFYFLYYWYCYDLKISQKRED